MKIQVNLPQRQVDWLIALAEVEGKSFTDILVRAVETEKFFIQYGDKILVENNGKLRKVTRK